MSIKQTTGVGLDVFHCSAGTNLVFGKVVEEGMYTGHPEQGGYPSKKDHLTSRTIGSGIRLSGKSATIWISGLKRLTLA